MLQCSGAFFMTGNLNWKYVVLFFLRMLIAEINNSCHQFRHPCIITEQQSAHGQAIKNCLSNRY